MFAAHDHRLHFFWMLGDRSGVDVELDTLDALADELRQPAQRWHVGTGRTMLALMEGRFDDAEALIEETAALGRYAQSWNAAVVRARRAVRPAPRAGPAGRARRQRPAARCTSTRRCCASAALSRICEAELGHPDEARAVLRDVLRHDLANEYRDAEWMFSMALLAAPAAAVGDADAAATVYRLLEPFAHALRGGAGRGCVRRRRPRPRRGRQRARDATTTPSATSRPRSRSSAAWAGARGWPTPSTTWARRCFARGDADRAAPHLDDAVAGYRALGMESWAERAAALR